MNQDKRRNNSKMNAQVLNCMKIMEFENLEEIPKMKHVRKKFIRLVKAKHPDGGQGSEEDFRELFEAKEFLMNYIKRNLPEEPDMDDDEILARKEFEVANIEKIKLESVTIYIPSSHVSAWKICLSERYGEPISLPTKYGSVPLQLKTTEGVSITIWSKETQSKSTMLIQGRTGYLQFAQNRLPNIFKGVAEILDTKKRKIESRPDISLLCDKCEEIGNDIRKLKIHKLSAHTKSGTRRKKSKNVGTEVVKNQKGIKNTLNRLSTSSSLKYENSMTDVEQTNPVTVLEKT